MIITMYLTTYYCIHYNNGDLTLFDGSNIYFQFRVSASHRITSNSCYCAAHVVQVVNCTAQVVQVVNYVMRMQFLGFGARRILARVFITSDAKSGVMLRTQT